MDIEIFKVGKHTASNGTTKDFTLSDVRSIIDNFSEDVPIVVGHPKTDSHAFGWINSLYMKGKSLFAKTKDIVPEFLELLKKKVYKNRSVSLSQNNDGTFSLNHVGFLGGTLPAVKELKALNLNVDVEKEISFEFAIPGEQNNSTVPGPISVQDSKDNFSEMKNLITEVQESISNLRLEFMDQLSNQNNITTPDIQAQINELETKLSVSYFQMDMIDKLQMKNLTPALKDKIVSLLSYFKTLNFSEDKREKLLSDFQELIDLVEPFQTEEHILLNRKKEIPDNEFESFNVDDSSMEFFNQVKNLSEEKKITFNEALSLLV